MQNYHKHTFFSNTLVGDCAASYEDYVKRVKELPGHRVISSVEHGFQSNYYVPYELVVNENAKLKQELDAGSISHEEYEERKLKFIFGAEAYWVKDRKKEYPVKDKVTGKYQIDKKTDEIITRQDRSNCHIVLLAKNEEGRRDINEALSDANIDGYYGQPRVDMELLLRIKPENVMITTACLKYWVYDDIDEITKRLHEHFGNNMYLEIQYHNTDIQKKINKHILELSEKFGIDIILGYDSHYILPSDSQERNNYLEGRGIKYDDDEIGWYMDYPDDDTAFNRLMEQNILSEEQAHRCMKNCDKILEFEDLFFDKEIKLPSIYKDKTQEWKNEKLRRLVYDAWEKEKKDIDPSRYKEYEDGIEYELNAIINTNMADYFLDDYEIVKLGKEKGGVITKTGRGSGVSYYVNSLLGFSNIDRFISPVKLYPDRFISETRILQTRSLPDLDLNLGTVEPFAEAQVELMGEDHAYPMISYKPLQASSAFKLYAKSQKLEFEIACAVTKQIQEYEKALKHADSPEEKEALDVFDFVEKDYHSYLKESEKYQKIINAKSQAPCGYLIYDGSIKREVGLIRCVSETTKKSVLTTVIDGMVAENYKFVKNDLLKVDVWLTINKICEKANIKTPTVPEMTKLVDGDAKTWEVYAKGLTMGVNQCESHFGVQCCKRLKPQSIQELCGLVAALRPGFKKQLDTFLNREPYTNGVKELDDLLDDSFHFLMYQENIMSYLGWLGIPQTETYAIIKKISKKKFKAKELAELKAKLLDGWIKNTGREDGFMKTWETIEASARYCFNASHSLSYAYDSVYGAYLKAHYPYEFYSVMLQHLSEKGQKKKNPAYKSEMFVGYGIKEGAYKFRNDNRTFVPDKEHGVIQPSLLSLKNMSQVAAEELYEMRNETFNSFMDFLFYLKNNHSSVSAGKLDVLCCIDYFTEFGEYGFIMKCREMFDLFYSKSTLKKDKLDELHIPYDLARPFSDTESETRIEEIDSISFAEYRKIPLDDLKDCMKKSGTYSSKLVMKKYRMTYAEKESFCTKKVIGQFAKVDIVGFLNAYEESLDKHETSNKRKILDQYENIGEILERGEKYKGFYFVTDISVKGTPKITAYVLLNGNTTTFKIDKKTFAGNQLKRGDIIKMNSAYKKKKAVPLEKDDKGKVTKWGESDIQEWWTNDYKVVN